MAIKSYFFNAVLSDGVYDRLYNSEDVTSYLDLLVGNGVFASPANQLKVQASTGMNVIVNAGQGWINGHKIINTAALTLEVDASDVLLNRIDDVIFYVDFDEREMGIEILKGTPAVSAVAPTLTRTSERYEMCLAQISVAKQVTAITGSMITDTRGITSLCGYVAGLIEQIDTTDLFEQWEDSFDDWFSEVKDTLSTATLLRKFEGTYTTQTSGEYSFNVLSYVPQYNYLLDVLEVRINGLTLNSTEYGQNGSLVVLNTPITETDTPITFTVYKSVDGSDAETIIDQVAEMQRVVNMLETGVYIATGVDDNIKLSDTVKAYLEQTSKNMLQVTAASQVKNGVTFTINSDGVTVANGTASANTYLKLGTVSLKRGVSYMLTGCPVGGGNEKYRLYWQNTTVYDDGAGCIYTPTQDEVATVNLAIYEDYEADDLTFYPMVRLASISDGTWEAYGTTAIDDYRQIEIDVYGDLACSSPATTVGDLCYWFDFNVQDATRRVRLNFEHCPRVTVNATSSSATTDVFMYAGETIEILNLQAIMSNVEDGNMLVSNGVGDFIDCAFWLNGASGATGSLVGANSGNFTRCRMSVTAQSDIKAYGFSGDGNVLRLNDCEVIVYNPSSASNESVAVHVQANETENVLIMDGCSCPIRSRSGYKQDNVVKINSGYYALSNNMLGKAALKYSTGDGKTETGTMIISK